eukprot:4948399-Amphidinium_carterae.1
MSIEQVIRDHPFDVVLLVPGDSLTSVRCLVDGTQNSGALPLSSAFVYTTLARVAKLCARNADRSFFSALYMFDTQCISQIKWLEPVI